MLWQHPPTSPAPPACTSGFLGPSGALRRLGDPLLDCHHYSSALCNICLRSSLPFPFLTPPPPLSSFGFLSPRCPATAVKAHHRGGTMKGRNRSRKKESRPPPSSGAHPFPALNVQLPRKVHSAAHRPRSPATSPTLDPQDAECVTAVAFTRCDIIILSQRKKLIYKEQAFIDLCESLSGGAPSLSRPPSRALLFAGASRSARICGCACVCQQWLAFLKHQTLNRKSTRRSR